MLRCSQRAGGRKESEHIGLPHVRFGRLRIVVWVQVTISDVACEAESANVLRFGTCYVPQKLYSGDCGSFVRGENGAPLTASRIRTAFLKTMIGENLKGYQKF